MNKYYFNVSLIALTMLLLFLDFHSTLLFLGRGGVEGNILIRVVLELWGISGLALVKILYIMLLLVAGCWFLKEENRINGWLIGMSILYIVVVINNYVGVNYL